MQSIETETFGRDAILRTSNPSARLPVLASDWATAREAWLRQIESENLCDALVQCYRSPTEQAPFGMRLRPTDGAFLRKTGKPPMAMHLHAWRQLVGLLAVGQQTPGMATAFAWLTPATRALAFAELTARSTRPEGADSPMFLRSHVDPGTGLRALRAVLSGVHSGTHFDDRALISMLTLRVGIGAPARIERRLLNTYGSVQVGNLGAVAPSVTFENSETGGASLRFWASCTIRVVDSAVRFSSRSEVDTSLTATVATARGASARRHTLPRAHRSEEERAVIAGQRMFASFDGASENAVKLAAHWDAATRSFAPGFAAVDGLGHAEAAAVLVDSIIERAPGAMRGTAEDRAALQQMLCEDTAPVAGLRTIPYGSAAHIAACLALLGRNAGTHEDATRLAELAGEWVLGRGWSGLH